MLRGRGDDAPGCADAILVPHAHESSSWTSGPPPQRSSSPALPLTKPSSALLLRPFHQRPCFHPLQPLEPGAQAAWCLSETTSAECGVENFFFRLHISFPASFSISLLWFALTVAERHPPVIHQELQLPPPSFLSPKPPPSPAPASDCTCAAIIMKSKLQAVSWLLVHPG